VNTGSIFIAVLIDCLIDITTIDSSQITVEAFYDGFRISWTQQNFVDNQAISYHLQMAKGADDYVNIYRGSTSKFTLKRELEGGILYRWDQSFEFVSFHLFGVFRVVCKER